MLKHEHNFTYLGNLTEKMPIRATDTSKVAYVLIINRIKAFIDALQAAACETYRSWSSLA